MELDYINEKNKKFYVEKKDYFFFGLFHKWIKTIIEDVHFLGGRPIFIYKHFDTKNEAQIELRKYIKSSNK